MRKLKLLVVTLMMTLLMASPAFADVIINQFGTVNINSNNETTRENNETTTVEDQSAILSF